MAASLPEKSQTASDWIATLQLRWLALIGERFSPLPNRREFATALAGAHTPVRSEVPGTAAARSSYRPAAKAPRRTAELLPLQSRAVRGAVDGSLPPARILRKTMSSTAGNDTAKDSMDEIKADPEQRPQGTSPPSLLGSYFEAGDEDQGEELGTTQVLIAHAFVHRTVVSYLAYIANLPLSCVFCSSASPHAEPGVFDVTTTQSGW